MNLIVAVGGTGQMVAHYYTHLYLLNAVREPFRLVVIDTDEVIGSLQRFADFLTLVALGQEPGASRTAIASIETIRVQATMAAQVSRSLAARDAGDLPASHPSRVWFSSDALAQTTGMGLYARPALATVLAFEEIIGKHADRLRIDDGSRVMIVGSLIGGTGAGLMTPLLSRLARQTQAKNNVSIRAVLFGEYFQPKSNVINSDEKRFRSNKVLGCTALAESAPSDLHSFVFIEEPRMPERDPSKEKTGIDVIWPPVDAPYWQGVCSLQHLLTETTRDAHTEFFNREVTPDTNAVSHDAALQLLAQRLGVTDAMVGNDVVPRLAAEPFCERTWGRTLPPFLGRYLNRIVRAAGIPAGEFSKGVQRAITDQWNGRGEIKPLRRMFPPVTGLPATPAMLRDTNWPRVSEQLDPQNFKNPERAYAITAACVLFHALKGGR